MSNDEFLGLLFIKIFIKAEKFIGEMEKKPAFQFKN